MYRPFGLDDLSSVPLSWRPSGPDFVGIAAPKAGTTWWYKLLLMHPRVKPNRLGAKELCYFHHFGYHELREREVETYRQAFATPDGEICGEWSPGYLWYPFVLDHLRAAAPHTKLLAMVRNPIDRAISHLNQLLMVRAAAIGLRGPEENVFKVFSLFPEALLQSRYADPFRRLRCLVPRSDLLVLQYEKCKLAAAPELARTYRFLGIDDSFVPQGLLAAVNKTRYGLPQPTEKERLRMADYFSPDVVELKTALPDIDLSLWPEFDQLA